MKIASLRVIGLWLIAAILAPAVVAAAPMSIEPGTDRLGGDYKGFALGVPDPQICRQACASDATCRAYTYVRPGVKGPQAMCFLKSSIAPATPDRCCTSGAALATGRVGSGVPQPDDRAARQDVRVRPAPPPPPAPPPVPSIAPPWGAKLAIDIDKVSVQWGWNAIGCFPPGAGQPVVPCTKVNDIQGFKIYRTTGALVVTIPDPTKRERVLGYVTNACYAVTAYKDDLESAKSPAVCMEGDGAPGPVVVVPGPAPKPPAIVRPPISGITVRGEENRAYFNSACPISEVHNWRRDKGDFNGAFPVGYNRNNYQKFSDQVLSSGPLCDALHTDWTEGSVKFDLSGLPADLAQATFKFTSTGTCAIAIHAYHITAADLNSQADHWGDGWFSYWSEGVVSGQTQNAAGDTSTSQLGVTALIKKALKSGKTSIGFVFYTDEALKNDAYTCASTYSGFTLEVVPKG